MKRTGITGGIRFGIVPEATVKLEFGYDFVSKGVGNFHTSGFWTPDF